MLASLLAYAKNSGLNSEPGFTQKTVKWAVLCNQQGDFLEVISLGEKKGRDFPICPMLNQGELIAGDTARCHFLVESLATLALFWKEGEEEKKQQKFIEKQKFFISMLQQASESEPLLMGASKLLSDEQNLAQIQDSLLQQKAKPTDSAMVMVDDQTILDSESWHEWWRSFRAALNVSTKPIKKKVKPLEKRRCLATGDWVEAVETHPKIKGLAGVGGLGTGDVLVGFDKAAFQSYGLKKSYNAAMSEKSANTYAEALNQLIQKKSVRLGNMLSVYWFKESISEESNILDWLVEPEENKSINAEYDAKKILQSIQSGGRPELLNNRYYNVLLSGASGRVMVRDWVEGDFEQLCENVAAWFDDFEIVHRQGNGLAPRPKFMAVAGSMVRDLKELSPPLLQALWHSALDRRRVIPQAVMAKTLQRVKIHFIKEEVVRHASMGLLKAYHCRLSNGGEFMKAKVNPEHPEVAYHCGRLLAVLARLQWSALGDVGAGVVQRHYMAVSQTPALVVGRLLANAKNHLNSPKVKGKLAFWFEGKIADIMVQIGDVIPATLNLEKQSLFALGYYQQLAALREKKSKVESVDSVVEKESEKE